MANIIKIKSSGNVSAAPTTLEFGELAINYADGTLFYKDSSNTIVSFSLADVQLDLTDLKVDVAMQTF